MTQAELGAAVGFSSGPDIRIAQYESNARTPKERLKIRMAEILNINPINFTANPPDFTDRIIQMLFWLDEGAPEAVNLFEIVNSTERYVNHPEFYDGNSGYAVGISFNNIVLNNCLRAWVDKKAELKAGKITIFNYFEWKLKFSTHDYYIDE